LLKGIVNIAKLGYAPHESSHLLLMGREWSSWELVVKVFRHVLVELDNKSLTAGVPSGRLYTKRFIILPLLKNGLKLRNATNVDVFSFGIFLV